MRQEAIPLPPDVPTCVADHHPHLVRTYGTPRGANVGAPTPLVMFHIECCRCQVATVPHPSLAITEARWTDPAGTYRIPLSHLTRAREQFAAAALAA
ncbi:hypothetical protein CSC62_07410 [Pseudoxanthomonas jiangsuensis]|uniref:hypothetical protein n=1 Tax=Pseudoxanthomonas jiangsuensis TaxID=619688 RepID=UPI0013909244|nr:hypothetical protein [Pseudoxanthomonas jiangsuensis]KAF1697966.1 hypothetical protein CSC62_07410 [Pseudoxanthomonas jiangsuensis]